MEDDGPDFRSVYSRTLYAPITRVFPPHDNDPIHHQIARAIVLYEDIRLEAFGVSAQEGQLRRLDIPSKHYRELYFMRRASVTLLEFAHAVHHLQTSDSFKKFKAGLAPRRVKPWSDAVKFFAQKRDELKRIRDAVGGHFGVVAARNGIQHASPDYVAKVQVESDLGERNRVTSEFTTELVAAALLAECPGNNPQERAAYLMELVEQAHRYAAQALHFLIVEYLWPRFGHT